MNNKQLKKNLEVALSYLEKGISVMPIWSPEMIKQNPERFNKKLEAELKENSEGENPLPEVEVRENVFERLCKVPALDTWKEYQTRLPTVQEVTGWFTNSPTANIAIITGTLSGIVVFDVDSQEGIDYADNNGGFPITVRVKTGKGFHYYMKHPGDQVFRNRVNRKLTLDIRADGGYVVAPPSTHGSGTQYQWEEGASIFDLESAECTPWMLDYIRKANTDPSENKGDKDTGTTLENQDNEPDRDESQRTYAEILTKGCEKGERNQTATQLIGHLLGKGLSEKEVWGIAINWNKNNKPPMNLPELRKTFDSVKAMELESAQRGIDIETLLDTPQKVVKEYEENYVRIPFGGNNLTSLEKKMNGGLIGGRLYILGGIPTSGKTVLMNNIADNVCLNNFPVLFFSYDDGQEELRYRTLARLSQTSIELFNTRSEVDIETLCKDPQVKKVLGLKRIIERVVPIEEWKALVDKIKARTGHPPVIFIDYLRKLKTKETHQDERLRIDDIVSSLTNLAKDQNIPIVAISELARESYKSGQKLGMASFKESGMIEYEASWLGILAPVEDKDGAYELKGNWESIVNSNGDTDLIIFKAKRGTGFTGRIPLKVDKGLMTVKDRSIGKPLKQNSSIFGHNDVGF